VVALLAGLPRFSWLCGPASRRRSRRMRLIVGDLTEMISPRLKSVILRELDLDDCDLTSDMTADRVPGWDSLSHVGIIDRKSG
jgi:hypothetical protein